MSAVLSPPTPRTAVPWGRAFMETLLVRGRLLDPGDQPEPLARRPRQQSGTPALSRFAEPKTESPGHPRVRAVFGFLWATVRAVVAVPFAILAVPLMILEGLAIVIGSALSFIHLGLALALVALLPRPLARRTIFSVIPSLGSFWKIELILEPMLNWGERLKVAENLTDDPHYGVVQFTVRTVLGYLLYLPTRLFQLVACTWAFGIEQLISMVRYPFGGLAYAISPQSFHPATRWLWMPLFLGEFTTGMFADELGPERRGRTMTGLSATS